MRNHAKYPQKIPTRMSNTKNRLPAALASQVRRENMMDDEAKPQAMPARQPSQSKGRVIESDNPLVYVMIAKNTGHGAKAKMSAKSSDFLCPGGLLTSSFIRTLY